MKLKIFLLGARSLTGCRYTCERLHRRQTRLKLGVAECAGCGWRRVSELRKEFLSTAQTNTLLFAIKLFTVGRPMIMRRPVFGKPTNSFNAIQGLSWHPEFQGNSKHPGMKARLSAEGPNIDTRRGGGVWGACPSQTITESGGASWAPPATANDISTFCGLKNDAGST